MNQRKTPIQKRKDERNDIDNVNEREKRKNKKNENGSKLMRTELKIQ